MPRRRKQPANGWHRCWRTSTTPTCGPCPGWHGVRWASLAAGDPDDAIRHESASLEELRGQDEPYWTAAAALSVGSIQAAIGRDDDAVSHLSQARELADRFSYHWLAAWSRVQLGTLNALRGRLDQARNLLDEALNLSLVARSTSFVALCLAAQARLAFAQGDLEQTALLEGAADGLRRRAGLRAWPMLRPTQTELTAKLRQALSADRPRPGILGRLPPQPAAGSSRSPGPASHPRPDTLGGLLGKPALWCSYSSRRLSVGRLQRRRANSGNETSSAAHEEPSRGRKTAGKGRPAAYARPQCPAAAR